MDRDVTHKILYGPKWSWGPYTIWWVTDRSINCYLARSAMNYLLYYTQYMQICQTSCFCYCISKTKNEFGQIRKKTLYWSGPVNVLKYWPSTLTKTNRENKNVKYNTCIYIYTYVCVCVLIVSILLPYGFPLWNWYLFWLCGLFYFAFYKHMT